MTATSISHIQAQAGDIDENPIRAVVSEFYRRARRDAQIGPVFEVHVHHWEEHLAQMTDFWSGVLLVRVAPLGRCPVAAGPIPVRLGVGTAPTENLVQR